MGSVTLEDRLCLFTWRKLTYSGIRWCLLCPFTIDSTHTRRAICQFLCQGLTIINMKQFFYNFFVKTI